jgi:hypothetical protein
MKAPTKVQLGCYLLLLGILPVVVNAAELSREKCIAELIKIAGVAEVLDLAREDASKEAHTKVERMLGQLRNNMPELTPAQHKDFDAAVDKFSATVASPYDFNEASTAWAKSFTADFTDEELNKLVKFSRTPLGGKELKAATVAAAQWRVHLQEQRAMAIDNAGGQLMARIREILANRGSEGPPAAPSSSGK